MVARNSTHVVPGNPVERRARAAREDQEREGQHAHDQQVVVFGVELRVADEEAQRELLVDAQEDGRPRSATTSSQRQTPVSLRTRVTSASTGPCAACGSANSTLPVPAGLVGAGDTGLLMLRATPVRPEMAGADLRVGAVRRLSRGMPTRSDYSNTGSMPAAVSAALRAAIQPLAKASLSSGGLVFRNAAQAAASVSWRLSELLVVRLVLGLPDARLLERLHRALVVGQHPGQVLALELEAGGARRPSL